MNKDMCLVHNEPLQGLWEGELPICESCLLAVLNDDEFMGVADEDKEEVET